MKHDPILRELLRIGMQSLGLAATDDLLSALLEYGEWLLETNKTTNLTSINEPKEMIRLHLLDSLVAAAEVLVAPPGPLLDIGTGGGVPGIPLMLVTDRPGTLLDSVTKKASLVGSYLGESGIPGRSVAMRAEELALQEPEGYAVAVSRAVAGLASLVELAAPLLHMEGHLVCLKARVTDTEQESGRAAAELCGLEWLQTREVSLPGGDEMRTIVTYVKKREPARTLPRRVGLAQRRPLA